MIGFKSEIDAENGLQLRRAAVLHKLDRAIEANLQIGVGSMYNRIE